MIIPLIRMMTYNIYKTLSPKFLAHAVSLYPFVKNSIIFYSIHDVLKKWLFKKRELFNIKIIKDFIKLYSRKSRRIAYDSAISFFKLNSDNEKAIIVNKK